MEVKWRKNKIIDYYHELWEFYSCNKYFSCICPSTHKKRNPRRIFLRFAEYRPLLIDVEFIENESSFLVEEKFIYKKSIE